MMTAEHTNWLPQLRKHTTVQLLVHYLRSNLQVNGCMYMECVVCLSVCLSVM